MAGPPDEGNALSTRYVLIRNKVTVHGVYTVPGMSTGGAALFRTVWMVRVRNATPGGPARRGADQLPKAPGGPGTDSRPAPPAVRVPAGLVHVGCCAGQLGPEFRGDRRQRVGGAMPELADGRGANGHAERVRVRPGDPALADAVGPAQEGAGGLEAPPVAAPHPRRRGRAGDPPAPGAGEPVPPVLGDVRPNRGGPR